MEPDEYNNPWSVKELEEFLYFCCPECEVKDQSRETFIKHALDHHPNSKKCLMDFMEIKREVLEENETSENWFYGNEIVKCEIKEESNKENPAYDSFEFNLSQNENEFQCDKCDKSFARKVLLKKHIDFVHEGILNYKCELCTKAFESASTLKRHIMSVHERVKHNCEICGKSFTQMYYLKLHHTKEHQEEELIYHMCNTCNKEFYSTSALAAHVQRVHENLNSENTSEYNELSENDEEVDMDIDTEDPKNDKSKCKICSKIFVSPGALRRHIVSVHEQVKHNCEVCFKSFTQMYYLKLHHSKEHPEEELIYHNCNTCGKEFYSTSALAAHVQRIHGNIKFENTSEEFNEINEDGCNKSKFKCEFCNKDFSSYNGLNQHIKSAHEGIRHKCELCTKSFSQMYQLKLHHKKEHPDEELIYHNCNICGKEFYSPFALASHVERIHENFKSDNTSDFNEMTEDGTLRFRCDFCNKTFSQHNSLKQHIMTAHEGKSWSLAPLHNTIYNQMLLLIVLFGYFCEIFC